MARENADGLLCWLKGPALAGLLVVGRDGGAKQTEVAAATGWGRNAIYTALGKLADGGLVRRDEDARWLLTRAGGRAWAELTGARPAVPKGRSAGDSQGTAAPESGTVGNGVPQNGSKRRPVPANGTKKGTPVPRSGTKRGKAVPAHGTAPAESVPANGTKNGKRVPASGTKRGKAVPANGTVPAESVPASGTKRTTSVPENGTRRPRNVPRNGTRRPRNVPRNGTAFYVDHDDHVVDDDQTSINNILQRLEALPDPFGGAAERAPQQDQKLLPKWVDFLEQAPPEWHARFGSSTAFMRTRVEAGLPPPRLPSKRPEQRTCAQCGHAMWDADGSCLVCSGVVKY
jgi:hypothetical protein